MHWIDPLSLPNTEGEVARFLFNAEGHADGFLFATGQQVHFPPHLSPTLLKRVKVGERVRVRALKPRGADVLVALSLTTHGGHTLEDLGEPVPDLPARPKHKKVQFDGVVTRCLYAPRGAVSGALLEDGSILRMHHKDNDELLHFLRPGTEITVWGEQIRVRRQNVIDIAHLALA
jgi:hypothetical protein